MKIGQGIFGIICLFCTAAQAQIGDTPEEISVLATVCEPVINGESKASARVRAADKASFKAVEEIPELNDFRSHLSTHNFNIKVYRLVDNYLEDVKISVVEQSAANVCVEVSAYLPVSAVAAVFEKPDKEAQPLPDLENDMALELEGAVFDEIGITIPPKPDIVINQEIAYDDTSETLENTAARKTVVFIDKTEFYNGTSTSGFFAALEQKLLEKDGVKVVAELGNSDYILKTKILKAKVDNINSETSRMQIVVALELTDTASSETVIEHQNRFILFTSSDDAQKVAANLAKDLLTEGASKLLRRIKTPQSAASHSVITPQ